MVEKLATPAGRTAYAERKWLSDCFAPGRRDQALLLGVGGAVLSLLGAAG